MKRQNGGCSASALFKAAVFSLLGFSQFAPTAWAQNRLRYPTAQAPIQGAVDTAYGDTTDAANAPQFSAPALGPATPELSRPSLNAPSPNTPAMNAPSLNEAGARCQGRARLLTRQRWLPVRWTRGKI